MTADTGNWLICYDIANPKRLQRIHYRVARKAMPVQYSVYLFHGSAGQLEALFAELETLIHPKEDDIRAYPVPPKPELETSGRPWVNGAVHLFGEGMEELLSPGMPSAKEDLL